MEYKPSKSVFDEIMDFVSEVKSHKKKTLDKQRILEFFEDLYKNKQTVQTNIGTKAVKFEGLNDEQVECFLKIFDGYKEHFEKNSNFGKIVRHEDHIVNNNGFEDVTTASAEKVIMMPTPPVN